MDTFVYGTLFWKPRVIKLHKRLRTLSHYFISNFRIVSSSFRIDFEARVLVRNRYSNFDGIGHRLPVSSVIPFPIASRCTDSIVVDTSHNSSTANSDVFCAGCHGGVSDHFGFLYSIFHSFQYVQLFLK